MEVAVIGEQVAELQSLVPLRPPGDLMAGASPVALDEHRPAPLAHLPVETRIVGDDHRRVPGQRLDCGIVDALTRDIRIGNLGQPRDDRRNRPARLVQLVEGLTHAIDATAGALNEREDDELDDLVGCHIGAGGLDVENEAGEGRLVRRLNAVGQRRQSAQHPVVPGAFEDGRDAIERLVHLPSP